MKIKYPILFVLLILFVTLGCTDTGQKQQTKSQDGLGKAPLSLPEIKEAISKENTDVILFFWFPQGSPCRQQDRILKDIESKYRNSVEVVRISSTNPENEIAFKEYSYLVRGVPTTVIVNDQGNVVTRFYGVAGEKALLEAIGKN